VSESFFDALDERERVYIRDRTNALVKALEEWIQQYPLVRPTRILTASLETATTMPRTSFSDALLAAQMILWIYALDDVCDDQLFTIAELQDKVDQWCLIASQGSSSIDANDNLATMLADMRSKLLDSPVFDPLRKYWTDCLRLLVEAMIQEYQYGLQYSSHGAKVLPSLDEYLQGGIHSIGLPFWMATVLILLKDSSVLECFGPVRETIHNLGAALRLYNDMRTFDKEVREGGVNSILITYCGLLDREPDVDEERALFEARQVVLRLADSYTQKCCGLVEQLGTDSKQIEECVTKLVGLYGEFYGHSEQDCDITSLGQVDLPVKFSFANGLFQ
jgi:hypothetical protein